LADYLSGYAAEYLASAGISCRFKIPITLPGATLEGRVRHDLFLAIKETLHNIVQHARATEVEFHLTCEASLLEILIVDNGCGFVSLAGEGHGLKYLPARLAQLGGRCQVVSTPDKGTRVQIQISLPQTMPAGKSA
jgi:signal transduction histidine kinase